jgi:hypothetical protein
LQFLVLAISAYAIHQAMAIVVSQEDLCRIAAVNRMKLTL